MRSVRRLIEKTVQQAGMIGQRQVVCRLLGWNSQELRMHLDLSDQMALITRPHETYARETEGKDVQRLGI